jgi:hypothetical protein
MGADAYAKSQMKPARTKAFASPAAFRAWLARHHETTDELFIRCAKVDAGRGPTYRHALDEGRSAWAGSTGGPLRCSSRRARRWGAARAAR